MPKTEYPLGIARKLPKEMSLSELQTLINYARKEINEWQTFKYGLEKVVKEKRKKK